MANNELQMPTAKKYKMPFKSITKRDGTLADFDGDKMQYCGPARLLLNLTATMRGF